MIAKVYSLRKQAVKNGHLHNTLLDRPCDRDGYSCANQQKATTGKDEQAPCYNTGGNFASLALERDCHCSCYLCGYKLAGFRKLYPSCLGWLAGGSYRSSRALCLLARPRRPGSQLVSHA